jgi:hypothetical protein
MQQYATDVLMHPLRRHELALSIAQRVPVRLSQIFSSEIASVSRVAATLVGAEVAGPVRVMTPKELDTAGRCGGRCNLPGCWQISMNLLLFSQVR